MERALGAALFRRRRSRGATLTSDGEAILPSVRRILTEGAELAATVGQGSQSIVGPVRIGCVSTLAGMLLPRLIIAVAERYPGMRLEYRIGDLTTLLAAAESGEVDLVVTFDIGVPPEYERVALAETEAMLVVSETHPLAGRERASLAEVAEEPMVLLDIASSSTHTLELMSARGITPRIRYRTADYEFCRALVGRGLGYTLLMRRSVSTETWDGERVVYLPIDPPPRSVGVLIACPAAPIPPRVGAVRDCAMDVRAAVAASMGGSAASS